MLNRYVVLSLSILGMSLSASAQAQVAQCSGSYPVTWSSIDDAGGWEDFESGDFSLHGWEVIQYLADNKWNVDNSMPSQGTYHAQSLGPGYPSGVRLRSKPWTMGPDTYLWFDHKPDLEVDTLDPATAYDGGVIEYTIDNGTTWKDLLDLPTQGAGYSAKMFGGGGSNPLAADRPVFAGLNSYVKTKVDLSSLAGETVYFRFDVGTDFSNASNGWSVDFIEMYQCFIPTCNGAQLDVDMNLGQLPAAGNVSQVIGGTPGTDIIEAFGGDDTVCGFDGYDRIYGGSGDDKLFGGDSSFPAPNDTIYNDLYGGTGNDLLVGGRIDAANWLFGQGGGDELYLGTILEGGSGGDKLDNTDFAAGSTMKGGGNNDFMYGSAYVDIMNGGPGLDYMEGNDGNDLMAGGNARDTMYGGPGKDTMSGGAANDFMYGNGDDDNISGNQGNDTIDGGVHVAGDICDGGGQTTADTFTDCEITSGFPAPPATSPMPPLRDGRPALTDEQVLLIDKCNLTVEECLGTNTRRR